MLKVLCVVDKELTAIDRLAQGVAKYHDNLDYKVVAVHPKRPDQRQIDTFIHEAKDADLIDWQYFRSAELLRGNFDWLKSKKQILTHNNPYSIREQDWNAYDAVVANNDTIYKELSTITNAPLHYIPLTVDTDFWDYNLDWTPNKNVIMVANRIESKKGILPVAIACAELNLHFILVGAISDLNYFHAISATTGNVEFHEQCSDEELRDLYHKSTIHVCNSVDDFESGTMPILEAMLCGVPVLSRSVGHVPDIYNGENMTILNGIPEDVLGIKEKLLEMIGDKKKLISQREKGWNSAKARSFERRAYLYQKLYREVLFNNTPVSVVVPIYDKPDVIRKCLDAIANQTYKNIELIVADDNPAIDNYSIVSDFAKYVNIPVRHIDTSKQYKSGDGWVKDYGLARARNEATIEATGEIMVYCDQRMIMDKNCIEEFVKHTTPKVWLYGNKGGKKDFVENLSSIKRQDVIDFGLFSERMVRYGGLSQETRNRFKHQGCRTEYVETAKATPTGKSSNRNRKKQDIISSKNRLWKMGLE